MSVQLTILDKDFNRQLERFVKKQNTQFQYLLADSTNKMHKLAVNKAPVQDGKLRQGIKQDIQKAQFTGIVESTAPYSEAVEKGTKPHHIEIKRKKVLAGSARLATIGVPTKGGWAIYGKRVQHPGTRPQPFLFPAWTVAKNYFMKQIKKLF